MTPGTPRTPVTPGTRALLPRLSQRLDVFDDRPHLVLRQLALEGRHVIRMAAPDLVIEHAVRVEGRAEIVREICGGALRIRVRAVACAGCPVALLAVRRENRLPLLDEIRRRLERALLLLAAGRNSPAGILRREGRAQAHQEN